MQITHLQQTVKQQLLICGKYHPMLKNIGQWFRHRLLAMEQFSSLLLLVVTHTHINQLVILKSKTAHSKKFNLQLGPNATVTSIATDINTDGWTEDTEESGDTEKVELPAVELISETAGMFTAETAITEQTSKQNCVEGWNTVYRLVVQMQLFQFDEAENADFHYQAQVEAGITQLFITATKEKCSHCK